MKRALVVGLVAAVVCVVSPSLFAQGTWTRGSAHSVLRSVQGAPESVSRYEALGYEVWKYGWSNVKVSTRDGTVLEWDNNGGNLKVELRPGGRTTRDPLFTRGSHKDDLVRLQGTPESVNRYEALGYEVWKYGWSNVKVSTRDGTVLEWDNQGGNLKVELRPGGRTTGAALFTRGSHKDDLVRLQGTPESVSRYEALGYEVWTYGWSNVKVSTRDGTVLEWDNQEGNLKVELRAGGQTTAATSVTSGTHQDDVIRLLGTPSGIARYPALGYETWTFPRGQVDISLHTHRVTGCSWVPAATASSPRELRYHTELDGVTAFYDENRVYANSFQLHDEELGDVYGFTDRGVTHYFDKALKPLRVASYWDQDQTLRVVGLPDALEPQRARLASRLTSISLSGSASGSGTVTRIGHTTFFDLTTNAGRSIHGSSMDIGSSSFDNAYQIGGPSISGSRTRIGNFSFGDWRTSDGNRVSGTSQQIGNFLFHDFRGSDGRTYRGTTTRIGRFSFTDISGSR